MTAVASGLADPTFCERVIGIKAAQTASAGAPPAKYADTKR